MPPRCDEFSTSGNDGDPSNKFLLASVGIDNGVHDVPAKSSKCQVSLRYPRNLNSSAKSFRSCSREKTCLQCPAGLAANTSKSFHCKRSIDNGDDLILSRLSELLAAQSNQKEWCNRLPPALAVVHDTAVIVPELIPAPRSVSPCNASFGSRSCSEAAVTNFLKEAGIEEVETLNQAPCGPTAGQCQFSSVAASLLDHLDFTFGASFRPDMDLRQLAVHTIFSNPHMYEDFLLANRQGRTTRASSRPGSMAAGRGVNLSQYLKNMSNPRCDGDAVTLQALCDSLKITVRIVKPVEASFFQGDWQAERVQNAMREEVQNAMREEVQNAMREEVADCNSGRWTQCNTPTCTSEESNNIINVSDEESSAPYTTRSPSPSLSTSSSEDEIEIGLDTEVTESGNGKFSFELYGGNIEGRKRLYISQEIQPRRLDRVDPRLLEVQQVTQGRLVWLSHIGDEAHYRYLRATSPSSWEEEACEASKLVRFARLHEICEHQDGLMKSEGSIAEEIIDKVVHTSDEKFDPEVVLSDEVTSGSRCVLCLERFSRLNGSPIVSPSACGHKFHQDCLSLWSEPKVVKCVFCSRSSFYMTDVTTNSEIAFPIERKDIAKYATTLDLDCVQDFLKFLEELLSDESQCSMGKLLEAMEEVFAWIGCPSKASDFCKEENLLRLFGSLQKFSEEAPEYLLLDFLDHGLLLALRTIVGLLEPLRNIFGLAIQGLLDFFTVLKNRSSKLVKVEHLEKSGGLPFFLLHQVRHANDLRDFFIFFCSLSHPTELEQRSKCVRKLEGTRKCMPKLEKGNGGKKVRSSKKQKLTGKRKNNDVLLSSNHQKKRIVTNCREKKKIVSKTPPVLPPVKQAEEVVVHRAPGKRRVKPVDTTNISREHLALRCYMGAV